MNGLTVGYFKGAQFLDVHSKLRGYATSINLFTWRKIYTDL